MGKTTVQLNKIPTKVTKLTSTTLQLISYLNEYVTEAENKAPGSPHPDFALNVNNITTLLNLYWIESQNYQDESQYIPVIENAFSSNADVNLQGIVNDLVATGKANITQGEVLQIVANVGKLAVNLNALPSQVKDTVFGITGLINQFNFYIYHPQYVAGF